MVLLCPTADPCGSHIRLTRTMRCTGTVFMRDHPHPRAGALPTRRRSSSPTQTVAIVAVPCRRLSRQRLLRGSCLGDIRGLITIIIITSTVSAPSRRCVARAAPMLHVHQLSFSLSLSLALPLLLATPYAYMVVRWCLCCIPTNHCNHSMGIVQLISHFILPY